ncbi:hypothetical protein GCM10010299_72970 [Streptomyces tanashiensis]|nr:hypothetical protein GCM10010299_72970 [Streptomyces tanashiensis]
MRNPRIPDHAAPQRLALAVRAVGTLTAEREGGRDASGAAVGESPAVVQGDGRAVVARTAAGAAHLAASSSASCRLTGDEPPPVAGGAGHAHCFRARPAAGGRLPMTDVDGG